MSTDDAAAKLADAAIGPKPRFRIGEHYNIHVYSTEDNRPVATFHDAGDARRFVDAANAVPDDHWARRDANTWCQKYAHECHDTEQALDETVADRNALAEGHAATIKAYEERRDALLALVAELSQETPLPDEAKGWASQRAALIAEVGALRAERNEANRRCESLARDYAHVCKQLSAAQRSSPADEMMDTLTEED